MKGQMNQWNKSAVGCFIRLLLVVAYVLGLALVPLPVGAATAQPLDEAPSWADELTFTLVNDPPTTDASPPLSPQAVGVASTLKSPQKPVSFTIEYLGTEASGSGTYTWTYKIVGVNSGHGLSFWNLELCSPAISGVSPGTGETYTTIGSYDGVTGTAGAVYTVEIGTDPHTHITGTKYEHQSGDELKGNDAQIFQFTLSDNFGVETVDWGSKASITVTTGTVEGPSCTPQSASIEKTLTSPADGTAMVGETVTFTIRITNTNTTSSTIVTLPLTDTYNATYLTFNNQANPTPNDFSSGVITWTDITEDLGDLDPGNSVTVTVAFRAEKGTSGTTNTAHALGKQDSAQVEIESGADLTISKADDPAEVIAGESLTYTLVYTNNGPLDAQDVFITDTLPSGVSFGGVVSEVPPIAGPTVTLPYLTWYTPTLTAGASGTLVFTVTVDASVSGTITNSVVITSGTYDGDTTNNTDTELTTVHAEADLAISKSDSPDPVIAGHSLTYTLVITNSGPSHASGVTVTDTLPAGVTFSSASSGCTYGLGTHRVTCTLGILNNGATATATIVVTVGSSTRGMITNTATVTATTTDPTPGNNTDSEETTVHAEADLGIITQSGDPEPGVAGRTLTYTLVYTNSGPSDAQDVYITRTLPTVVTYGGVVSEVPPIAGPTVTLPYLAWYTPTLAAKVSGTIVLTVTVNTDVRGTASGVAISSSTRDPDPGSNTDDGDSVGGEVEDGAPNNGDGNDDGIPDRLQENVTSLPNAVDQHYVTLALPKGTNFASVQACDNPSPGDAPPEVAFAVGCFECIVQGIPPGGSVTVTFFLPPGVAANTFDYYRFGATPDNPTPHWYQFSFDGTTGAEMLGNEDRIILYLVDGQRGDDDLMTNGEIVDWGCPGQPPAQPPPPPIPVGGVTLPVSAFELLAPCMGLAALMAVAAVMVRRRRA